MSARRPALAHVLRIEPGSEFGTLTEDRRLFSLEADDVVVVDGMRCTLIEPVGRVIHGGCVWRVRVAPLEDHARS